MSNTVNVCRKNNKQTNSSIVSITKEEIETLSKFIEDYSGNDDIPIPKEADLSNIVIIKPRIEMCEIGDSSKKFIMDENFVRTKKKGTNQEGTAIKAIAFSQYTIISGIHMDNKLRKGYKRQGLR